MSADMVGVYRHYKGGYYLVLGTCTHSETKEIMVRYRPMGGTGEWVRPMTMFNETVDTGGGVLLPRFGKVSIADL